MLCTHCGLEQLGPTEILVGLSFFYSEILVSFSFLETTLYFSWF